MATIGTFTKTADGAYTGVINTLSLNVKSANSDLTFAPCGSFTDVANIRCRRRCWFPLPDL